MSRTDDMRAMRESGETLAAIGARYGITRERVRQILQAPDFPAGSSVHLRIVDVRGADREAFAAWLRKQLAANGIGTHRA